VTSEGGAEGAGAYLAGSVVESPVALLLVDAAGRANAMTVSFFSEVAHHPTALWVSVAKSAYTHALLGDAGAFSLAVLAWTQRDLAIACGTVSGRGVDKCAGLALGRTPGGFLALPGALASCGCRVARRLDLGDHTLFVGEILEGETDSRAARTRHLLTTDL
jgi:flavin reductase (DIM6/NTAB) family NADH-FMN oxidoreductase RutF